MKKKLEQAIEVLADEAKKCGEGRSIEAQQYAQAVLNLTNAFVALCNTMD